MLETRNLVLFLIVISFAFETVSASSTERCHVSLAQTLRNMLTRMRRAPTSEEAAAALVRAQTETQARINSAITNGKLKMLDAEGNIVPLDVEIGRYYAVAQVPGTRLVAISQAPTRHGSHALLARNAFGRVLRPLDETTFTGGVIFTRTGGVQISGQSLRYPSDASARALARAFSRMGFRVELRTAGPIRETITRPESIMNDPRAGLGI